MEEPRSFVSLLVVVLLALAVPLVLSRFKRLRLPIVVGEILAGIIVGPNVLGLVSAHDPALDFLAEFGFVFLMFLSGMEVDFTSLGAMRGAQKANSRRMLSPVSLGLISFGITLGLAVLCGFGLVSAGLVKSPWMMALVLSTTSLGVVVPVLKEAELSTGRYGQTLLVAALIADFATMLLITVVVGVLSRGLTLDVFLIGFLFLAFFLMYRFGLVLNRVGAVRRTMEELSHATAQIKVRISISIMLLFVVLAQALGTEIILGAFMAGAIISLLRTPNDEDVLHQLDGIGFGFLIPIFFIMVGVSFDLSVLLASPQAMLLVPVLLAAAIVVKLAAGLVFRFNFPWRESLSAGALLSARLSLIIAASAIGLRLGVISEEVNAAIILVAILTVTFAPLIFLRLAPRPESAAPRWNLVAGAGQLGLQVAQQMRLHNEPVMLVDSDDGRIQRAQRLGIPAVCAIPDRPDAALAAIFDQTQTLICTYADTDLNYQVCHLAHTVYGIDHIIAQVTEPNDLPRFEQLGVTTMNAAVDRAALLVLLARNPALYDLLTRTDDNKEVSEVTVQNDAIAGKLLRQLALPGDVLVLAVRRQGEMLVPHGNTKLASGDQITLAGSLDDVAAARLMIGVAEYRAVGEAYGNL